MSFKSFCLNPFLFQNNAIIQRFRPWRENKKESFLAKTYILCQYSTRYSFVFVSLPLSNCAATAHKHVHTITHMQWNLMQWLVMLFPVQFSADSRRSWRGECVCVGLQCCWRRKGVGLNSYCVQFPWKPLSNVFPSITCKGQNQNKSELSFNKKDALPEKCWNIFWWGL